MDIELKYGNGLKQIAIPDSAGVEFLKPATVPVLPSITSALEQALENPIGHPDLAKLLLDRAPQSIVIAVPDETRPVPVKQMLPTLIDHIRQALPALPMDKITIIIGGGLHPPAGTEAIKRVAPPEIVPGCRIIAHDATRATMVDYGQTGYQTPVRINTHAAQADFKIVIGQIDPHQFVGFTGGAKGIVIGCGSPETIEHNHGLMLNADARVGQLDGNPVREDLNQAGEMIGIDLAVNVVMDANKQAVWLMAGQPVDVLRQGARICADVYGVAISNKFDIVIASCGGYPKDICLYQAQKGLNLASQALKPGGRILLLAASPQGVGDDIYFDYVTHFSHPEDVLRDFQKIGFRMGAHKAYLFGRTLTHFDVAVFSDLDPGILRQCHLRAADPTTVIQEWVTEFDGRPRIAVVPNANTTYFYSDQSPIV